MKKELKRYIFPLICVLIVIITFVLLFDMQKKASKIANAKDANELNTENVVDNTNNTNTNTVENEVDENSVSNETTENTNTIPANVTAPQSAVTSGDDDKLAENKQSQAVELVKQRWGADSKVYFTNESVKSTGEYIVAVRDKSTTEVKQYFKVNIETGTVVIDY